jgi:penicillin-insensitive murein DD-endopeptidase
MRRTLLAVALLLPLVMGGADLTWTRAARWSAQVGPKGGPAQAIGACNAGCLQGGVALPRAGPGFEVMHLGRHRYFGHPLLVEFVRRLAHRAAAEHLPILLVGDLGQPRGGPMPSDHGSHQSGLDVDIAYTRPPQVLWQPLPEEEREKLRPPPVVDLATQTLTAAWAPPVAELIRLAASEPAVDRIFVNPLIKRELCSHQMGGMSWLAKIRPWWGHHDHFHVRLACPAGSTDCRTQPPLPSGDGCDETLAWWFSEDARAALESRRLAVPRAAALPGRCREVLR